MTHGEPGIGKSSLLGYAMDSAAGFQVLRAVGNEAENELPFAAAQQLCTPGLVALEELPAPQREALSVAFGHIAGPAPDRLFVGLALLGLLSRLARKDPVLCVIDDAQWLDRESAQAFAIVARRLGSAHVVFLFGARTVPRDLNGLPDLPVGGLSPADARALLRSALPGPFDEHVLERTGCRIVGERERAGYDRRWLDDHPGDSRWDRNVGQPQRPRPGLTVPSGSAS